jgi:hypothetical protein
MLGRCCYHARGLASFAPEKVSTSCMYILGSRLSTSRRGDSKAKCSRMRTTLVSPMTTQNLRSAGMETHPIGITADPIWGQLEQVSQMNSVDVLVQANPRFEPKLQRR